MAHLVTKDNRDQYKRQMEQMYRLRHQVFVQQMGWKLPMADQEFEKDEYDDEDTVYILSLDQNLDVVGSMRLMPTTKPHLMSDLFSHLLAVDEPIGANIWESSRTCIKPNLGKKGEVNLILSDVFIGMTEAALILGIDKITFVANMLIYPSILKGGWQVTPLGFPKEDENGDEVVAASVAITQEALRNVRKNRGILHPTLNFTNPHTQQVA